MAPRCKRRDSFFGLHFDFHAGRNQTGIGENLDTDALEQMLDRVKPDYVQCDTKGHPGNSSYPTRVGYQAPDIRGDILAAWRRITADRGIALYAHHSGVWDNRALEHHPDWAAVNEKGEASDRITSVFGPYGLSLLAPQLTELALEYGLDGAWVDGECWALMPDYSPWAMAAWKQKTGKDQVEAGDMPAFLEMNRQGFRDYLTAYMNYVHERAPEFEIASNWLYTSYTPEKRTVPVDFISGDYAPQDSMAVSRIEAHCSMGQDRPWDLMAWGFVSEDGLAYPKELNQLYQEAASVISLGGGFQIYNRQLGGSVEGWKIPQLEALAKFCRARQTLCHQAAPVPQAAVIFSEAGYYSDPKRVIPYHGDSYKDMRSNTAYLLDNQISTEILKTHQTVSGLDEYPMVWVPNWPRMEPELVERLKAYVRQGGHLVASGPEAAACFGDLVPGLAATQPQRRPLYLMLAGRACTLLTRWQTLTAENADVVAMGFDDPLMSGAGAPAALSVPVGKGRLVLSGIALEDSHQKQKSALMRDYAGALARASGFEPAFTVEGSHLVETTLMTKAGTLRLNLTNMAGTHEDHRYKGFDEIPPLGPLEIRIRFPRQPRAVRWMPQGSSLEYHYEHGIIALRLDRLEIHGVIEVW